MFQMYTVILIKSPLNMKRFYHRSESPDYNINFFKDEKDNIKKIPKEYFKTIKIVKFKLLILNKKILFYIL